jgi:serpin B
MKELDQVLASLGVGIAFSSKADFTGMVESNAAITRVLQESYIGVDEKGVEAAAYTMVAMPNDGFAMPEDLPKIDFHLTRPFLYAIESYDGTVLFIGTVTNPTFES